MHGIFSDDIFGSSADDEWQRDSPQYQQYEHVVARTLEEEFSTTAYRFATRRAFEFEDGAEICPDIVIAVSSADDVECVADAKLRKELRSGAVHKAHTYKTLLKSNEVRLYVPQACKITAPVMKLAEQLGVRIIRLEPDG